jgi:hypothetical protein
VGTQDPRYNDIGQIDFRLKGQLAAYAKQDPPPNRVKPIPIQILHHVAHMATTHPTESNQAVADMIIVAFFFLLRPGEYTANRSESTPFRISDIQLFVGGQRLNLEDATDASIASATFATLMFTTQKNAVRGEVIGLGRSGNSFLCPVQAIIRRVLHLRKYNAPPNSPLASYFAGGPNFSPIMPKDITEMLRLSTAAVGPSVGFLPADISARSLRAAGAMALLCAHVDSDTIRLVGRWRSDEMLRYLHVQAEPVMRDFSRRMLHGGDFSLLPSSDVPIL